MTGPLISVIVPIYNSEIYLKKCIKSIVNQTYNNLEIILIDDGSLDKSLEICNKYKSVDKRIKVIHKINQGQAAARNLGLEIAKGEFVGFVDSDDYIKTEMYEILLKSLLFHNADISVAGRKVINFNSKVESSYLFTSESEVLFNNIKAIEQFLLMVYFDGSPCDKLFKKKTIGKVRFPKGYICEDLLFVYEVIKKSKLVVQTGVPLYNYIQRDGSTSHPQIFSKKIFGLVIYPEKIKKDVYKNYNNLINEADFFYYINYIRLYQILVKLKSDKKILRNVRKVISKNIICILKCKHFNINHKIKTILISINLYKFVFDLKQLVS